MGMVLPAFACGASPWKTIVPAVTLKWSELWRTLGVSVGAVSLPSQLHLFPGSA